MKYLLRNGRIVSSAGWYEADLLIEGEKIVQLGERLSARDAQVIDAAGKYLFPGFVDTHTHFDLDAGDFHTADGFASGTRAALAGGTTSVLDFTTQEKGESLKQALDRWHRMAGGKACCDYGFHMSITDWNPAVRLELKDMARLGVTSYKLYMAYGNLMVNDREILEILEAVEEENGIVGVHCENPGIIQGITAKLKRGEKNSPRLHPRSRPAEAEAEAIHRLLVLARLAGAPVNIVHLSSLLGLREVRRGRKEGQQVFAETCPQYLVLDDSLYERPGFAGAAYVCAPPLRKREDVKALWEAVSRGELDMVGTDHCSFHMDSQKTRGISDFTRIPGGVPGVEHRPALFYHFGVNSGRTGVEEMCRLLSERPARIFGMYPKKGVLAPGSDADVVVWDPAAEWTIRAASQVQNVDYTPYEGMELKGRAEKVFLRGRLAAENGRICQETKGQYLSRGGRRL